MLEPAREPLVEFCPSRLGECLVRRIAKQKVTKSEAVLACEQRSVGPDQLLANERGEVRSDRDVLVSERLDGTAVEDLALDGAMLEHGPLEGLQLIEPSGEQRLQRGRNDDVAVDFGDHGEELADEERVAGGRTGDPLAQKLWELARDELVDRAVGERLQREGDRPGGTALDELGPRHAEEQDRLRPAESSATCSIRSRKVSSPHWMSSNTTTSGSLGSRVLERLAERPRDLLGRRLTHRSRRAARRTAVAAASSGGSLPSCLSTSTTGQ